MTTLLIQSRALGLVAEYAYGTDHPLPALALSTLLQRELFTRALSAQVALERDVESLPALVERAVGCSLETIALRDADRAWKTLFRNVMIDRAEHAYLALVNLDERGEDRLDRMQRCASVIKTLVDIPPLCLAVEAAFHRQDMEGFTDRFLSPLMQLMSEIWVSSHYRRCLDTQVWLETPACHLTLSFNDDDIHAPQFLFTVVEKITGWAYLLTLHFPAHGGATLSCVGMEARGGEGECGLLFPALVQDITDELRLNDLRIHFCEKASCCCSQLRPMLHEWGLRAIGTSIYHVPNNPRRGTTGCLPPLLLSRLMPEPPLDGARPIQTLSRVAHAMPTQAVLSRNSFHVPSPAPRAPLPPMRPSPHRRRTRPRTELEPIPETPAKK